MPKFNSVLIMIGVYSVLFCTALADDPGDPDSLIIGNLDGSHIQASPGDTIDIPLWLKNDEDVASMWIPIGTTDQFITERLGGILYDFLTYWDIAEFLTTEPDQPFPEYTTQTIFAVHDLYKPWNDSLCNTEGNWLKIADLTVAISPDTSNIGQSTQPIEGYDPPCGPAVFGDETGFIIWAPTIVGRFIDIVVAGCDYVPGDINGNGLVQGSDVTYGSNYFKGLGPPPPDSCWNDSTESWLYSACDCNGNCVFTGSDVTYLTSYLKGIGDPPTWCPQTPPLNPPGLNSARRGRFDGTHH